MDHDHPANPHAELFRVDDSDLRLVNRLLTLVAVGLAAWVFVCATRLESRLGGAESTAVGLPYVAQVPAEFLAEEAYVAQVGARNIFLSSRDLDREVAALPTERPRDEVKRALEQMKRDLLVVGVAWRPPQVVMLLDKRLKRTYHVREGQPIGDSDVVVESITRNVITIKLQDEYERLEL